MLANSVSYNVPQEINRYHRHLKFPHTSPNTHFHRINPCCKERLKKTTTQRGDMITTNQLLTTMILDPVQWGPMSRGDGGGSLYRQCSHGIPPTPVNRMTDREDWKRWWYLLTVKWKTELTNQYLLKDRPIGKFSLPLLRTITLSTIIVTLIFAEASNSTFLKKDKRNTDGIQLYK